MKLEDFVRGFLTASIIACVYNAMSEDDPTWISFAVIMSITLCIMCSSNKSKHKSTQR